MPWYFWVLIGVAIIGLILFLPIPKRFRRSKQIKINKRYPISGAMLGGINEVFQPSAANASVFVEEQRESRKALPSPEDKTVPGNKKKPQSEN